MNTGSESLVMTPTEPLPLYHSWPMTDVADRFDLGYLHGARDDPRGTLPGSAVRDAEVGQWSYDFTDRTLSWSHQMYRLFGLPCGDTLTRQSTIACYAESSRAAMERLRAYAIKHRRGFTLDIEITPIGHDTRWLRLVAAPVCEDGEVVRLHGYKADVSRFYPAR